MDTDVKALIEELRQHILPGETLPLCARAADALTALSAENERLKAEHADRLATVLRSHDAAINERDEARDEKWAEYRRAGTAEAARDRAQAALREIAEHSKLSQDVTAGSDDPIHRYHMGERHGHQRCAEIARRAALSPEPPAAPSLDPYAHLDDDDERPTPAVIEAAELLRKHPTPAAPSPEITPQQRATMETVCGACGARRYGSINPTAAIGRKP